MLVLAMGAPPCGHCAGVQWQAQVGFGGAFTVAAWVPVLVKLRNDGPAQQGRVTIAVQPSEYAEAQS